MQCRPPVVFQQHGLERAALDTALDEQLGGLDEVSHRLTVSLALRCHRQTEALSDVPVTLFGNPSDQVADDVSLEPRHFWDTPCRASPVAGEYTLHGHHRATAVLSFSYDIAL